MQAEEAAECERANADELLVMLKEKEVEVGHLRCAGGGGCRRVWLTCFLLPAELWRAGLL